MAQSNLKPTASLAISSWMFLGAAAVALLPQILFLTAFLGFLIWDGLINSLLKNGRSFTQGVTGFH